MIVPIIVGSLLLCGFLLLWIAVSGCDSPPAWNRDDLSRSVVLDPMPITWNRPIGVGVRLMRGPIHGLRVEAIDPKNRTAEATGLRIGDVIEKVAVIRQRPNGMGYEDWCEARYETWPEAFTCCGRGPGRYSVRYQRPCSPDDRGWPTGYYRAVRIVQFADGSQGSLVQVTGSW